MNASNRDYLASKAAEYPYEVRTMDRTTPRPERVQEVISSDFIRVPLKEAVVWRFASKEAADNFSVRYAVYVEQNLGD